MSVLTVTLDTGEVQLLAVRLAAAGGAVGAPAAAAVRKTAKAIEATMKSNAPKLSGELAGSISTSYSGDGRFSSFSAEIGPTARYGEYVEDGTSVMSGQPYAGPAFDQHASDLDAALAKIAGAAAGL
ncbi:MAG TPA: HK97-gp10 family putative phage morphogenesis protein [Propionibacteriaceae bacterium]